MAIGWHKEMGAHEVILAYMADRQPHTIADIAQACNLDYTTVQWHCKYNAQMGRLQSTRQGRRLWYTVPITRLGEVQGAQHDAGGSV